MITATTEPAPAEGAGVLDDFYRAKPMHVPHIELQHEKPEHRMLLYLKAQGLSNVEIAERTGYHVVSLSLIFRQPWAQERLVEILNSEGRDRIATLLEGSAEDSIHTLIQLRDDPDQLGTVRRSAASDLLDRYLGKPKQQVDVVTHKGVSYNDIAALDAQIAELKRQESILLGTVGGLPEAALPEAALPEGPPATCPTGTATQTVEAKPHDTGTSN